MSIASHHHKAHFTRLFAVRTCHTSMIHIPKAL
jgi:hypothetical protein